MEQKIGKNRAVKHFCYWHVHLTDRQRTLAGQLGLDLKNLLDKTGIHAYDVLQI